MKPVLPPEDNRPHIVLGTMAVGFLMLAAFFFVSGVFDLLDGNIVVRGNSILRSESPERFARMVRTSFGFGVTMLVISACCAFVGRLMRPKA